MSLIELMVGAAIGLIVIVIITHIYLTNEQHRRATTAAGGAQTNGAIALYALERDIRRDGEEEGEAGGLSLGDRLGDALMSRIYEMCLLVPVEARDFRRTILHARDRF